MGLKPPTPGLRALFHNSISPAKVQVSIPPGDVLHVSEELAVQLRTTSTHFEDVAPDDELVADEVAPAVDEAKPDSGGARGRKRS